MDHSDAAVARRAAEAGAAEVAARWGTDVERFAKSANDFATSADLAAEEAIAAVLRAERPEDAFEGEESGLDDAAAPRRWLVDPLCGTLNFAARIPVVAVNVALREPSGTRVAAVADPLTGEVWWTDGTSVRRGDATVGPDAASRLLNLNLDGTPRHGPTLVTTGLLTDATLVAAFGPRVVSSTLALAWVADGRVAAYVTEGVGLATNVHFAAGVALCRAAGCIVTGLTGGSLEEEPGGLVAAADTAIHATLLAAVRRTLSGGGFASHPSS